MIFCNHGPIASAWYIFFISFSYLGKEVVQSAHSAVIRAAIDLVTLGSIGL